MRVFYREEMIAESGSYSPSAESPRLSSTIGWSMHCRSRSATIRPCLSMTSNGLISPDYVEGVFSGRIANGHGNTSSELAESTRWTVGSLVAAAAMHWYPVWPVRRPADFITRPMRPAEVSARSTA